MKNATIKGYVYFQMSQIECAKFYFFLLISESKIAFVILNDPHLYLLEGSRFSSIVFQYPRLLFAKRHLFTNFQARYSKILSYFILINEY